MNLIQCLIVVLPFCWAVATTFACLLSRARDK